MNQLASLYASRSAAMRDWVVVRPDMLDAWRKMRTQRERMRRVARGAVMDWFGALESAR